MVHWLRAALVSRGPLVARCCWLHPHCAECSDMAVIVRFLAAISEHSRYVMAVIL